MSQTNIKSVSPIFGLEQELCCMISSSENSDSEGGLGLKTPQSRQPNEAFVLKIPATPKDLNDLRVVFRAVLKDMDYGWQEKATRMFELLLNVLECTMKSSEQLKGLKANLRSKLESLNEIPPNKKPWMNESHRDETKGTKLDLWEFISAASAIAKKDQGNHDLRHSEEKVQKREQPVKSYVRKCGICRQIGHRRQKCPQRIESSDSS